MKLEAIGYQYSESEYFFSSIYKVLRIWRINNGRKRY